MQAFIKQHLDPVDRLGEVLFGLIMALGFTGAVRLGIDSPNNRELFTSIFGCNLAWAIVDGTMYVMLALFERGRIARMVERVLSAPGEEEALQQIAEIFDGWLEPVTSSSERQQIYRWIMANVRARQFPAVSLQREDLLGGIAAGLAIVMATLPMLIPFLVVRNTELAVRLSNAIALAMLWGLGIWWGRMTAGKPWRVAISLMIIGLVLVLITVALGG